jgi:WhiB family transcriptional regulator, redox-sensing transcriptional regulator
MTTTADNLAEWWTLAACQSADPDLFFPISASGPARTQVERAKAVCAGCPVRSDCLRYALAAGPLQGVWGGLTEEERRLQRQREAKARMRASRRSGTRARMTRFGPAFPPGVSGRGCLEPFLPESKNASPAQRRVEPSLSELER